MRQQTNQFKQFLSWGTKVSCLSLFIGLGFQNPTLLAEEGQSPEALFKTLYGDRSDTVKESRDAQDDSALADEMTKVLSYDDLTPELKNYVAKKILELQLKGGTGLEAADIAVNWLSKHDKDNAGWAYERKADTLRLHMLSTPLKERSAVGAQYFTTLIQAGEAYEQAADPSNALTQYRKALTLGRYVEREQTDAARSAMRRVTSLSRYARELDQLIKGFVENPSVESADKIAHIYLVVFNAPDKAAPYATISEDKSYKQIASTHGKVIEDLDPDALLNTAIAYETIFEDAEEDYQKANLASRSMAFYQAFLGQHADQDIKRIKAVAGLNRMKENVKKFGGSSTALASRGVKLSEYMVKNWSKIKGTVWESNEWAVQKDILANATGNVDSQWGSPINLPIKVNGDYEFTAKVRMTKVGGKKNQNVPGGVAFHVQVGELTVPVIYRERMNITEIDAQKKKHGPKRRRKYSIEIAVPKPTNDTFNTVKIKVQSREDQAKITIHINGKPAIEYHGPVNELRQSFLKPALGKLSKNAINGLRHGSFELKDLTYSGGVTFADPQYK